MSPVRIINVSFQLWGSFMSLIMIFCLCFTGRTKSKGERLYIAITVSNIIVMLMDAIALYFRGRLGTVASIGVRMSNGLEFIVGAFVSWIFLCFVKVYLEEKLHCKVNKYYFNISTVFMIIEVMMVLVNFFYPFIYVIGSDNLYRRLPLYPLNMMPSFIILGITFGLVTVYHKKLEFWEKVPFYMYIVAPFVGLVGSVMVYGIVFGHIGTTFSIVIMFVFLQVEQSKRMIRQEQELTQSRVDIMMSQIQPHFLYNTLGTMSELCKTDPQLASQSIDDFAHYLRTNLGSVQIRHPIAFEKELDHVQTYIQLEQLRFGEDLQMKYDIEATHFRLPALTIQPIVENAVLHGMMGREGVCHIALSTKQLTDELIEIVVEDDGVGFDVTEKKTDGRNHIGLENVKRRIE